MFKRFLIAAILFSATFISVESQEMPVFNITGVDATEFPLVKSYFEAKNGLLNEDYYKAPQDIANPKEFDLKENGISKDLESLRLMCDEIKNGLPVHIALVVDASASMFNPWQGGETRADVLRRAVDEFIDSVKFENGSTLFVVPFAGKNTPGYIWKDWNTNAKDAKLAFTLYAELQGNTDFNTPLFKEPSGKNVLEIFKSRPANERKAVVFLSDGAHGNTNGNNPFMVDYIIQQFQERGIEFYGITFAADDYSSVPDLMRISQSTGGVFFNAYNESQLRGIYHQITDNFKSTSLCWLEWISQLDCQEVTERNVEVTFKRKSYTPIIRNITYTPPADKAIAKITSDKQALYFDNNGKTSQDITITAVKGDFHITAYSITNNNGDFDIPAFASMSPAGFYIEQGKSKTFTVNYIKNPSDTPVDFELTFETDLCPVGPIQLIAPCGPTTLPIDLGNVNLSGSTDYTATSVFTNTSTGELTGTLTLQGANASEFAIKSVDGKTGSTFTLQAGESMDVVLTITPTSIGTKTAELNYGITTDCGVALSSITANVIQADLKLAPYDFGLVRIDNPVKYTYTITNDNDNAIEIEAITLSNTKSGFTLGDVTNSIGVLTAKGGTTSFDVNFIPNAEGQISVDLQVKVKNRATPLIAKLSGTGFVPKIQGTNLIFPNTKVGETSTLNFEVENASDYGEMTISKIYLKSGSDNSYSLDLTGFSSGIKIRKGDKVTIPVEFSPSTIGIKNGIIIVEADNTVGKEPVTFILNEFTITGEAIPGDAVTLPVTEVGPILSCESREFIITLNNETNSPVTVDAELNPNTDFRLISDNFIIPANGSYATKLEYIPSGIGTHTATVNFNYSDGQKFIAPLKGTAINENADLIDFDKTQYMTLVGSTLRTHFNINLKRYNIRPDANVNQLKLTFRYNGRMLALKTKDIQSNLGLTPIVDNSNQVSGNYVTITYNGAIPLDKNLSFDIPYLTTLGNDTITTITASSDFRGLSCLTVDDATITSITTGCGIDKILIDNITIANKGFDVGLIGENPVNDRLGIKYELPYNNNVKIEVYDNSGRLVDILKNNIGKFGITEEYINVSGLSSGVYMLRFISGPFVENLTFMKIK